MTKRDVKYAVAEHIVCFLLVYVLCGFKTALNITILSIIIMILFRVILKPILKPYLMKRFNRRG